MIAVSRAVLFTLARLASPAFGIAPTEVARIGASRFDLGNGFNAGL
jgi:hypothetical protein